MGVVIWKVGTCWGSEEEWKSTGDRRAGVVRADTYLGGKRRGKREKEGRGEKRRGKERRAMGRRRKERKGNIGK